MSLIFMILSFICLLNLLSARPAMEPTKFTLGNIQNNAENVISSKLDETKQIHIVSQNNIDPLIIKSDKSQSRRSILSIPSMSTIPIISFRSILQETVHLENETAQGILERRRSNSFRQLWDNFLTPNKPLVDRIMEEEKYGNTGDRFIGIGIAIVNGFENVSNLLNVITSLPVRIVKQISREVTKTLNDLGARIVGL